MIRARVVRHPVALLRRRRPAEIAPDHVHAAGEIGIAALVQFLKSL